MYVCFRCIFSSFCVTTFGTHTYTTKARTKEHTNKQLLTTLTTTNTNTTTNNGTSNYTTTKRTTTILTINTTYTYNPDHVTRNKAVPENNAAPLPFSQPVSGGGGDCFVWREHEADDRVVRVTGDTTS